MCNEVVNTSEVIQMVLGNSSGKLVQDPKPKVEQKPDVDIDLKVQEVAQDAILQDESQMKEINQKVSDRWDDVQ